MPKRVGQNRALAIRLTGIIQNCRDASEKLWWNLEQFESALSETKLAGRAQSFAFIDYAVAESALHAWVLAEHVEALEASQGVLSKSKIDEIGLDLISRVKWSPHLRSVANSAKHADYADHHWPGGANVPMLNMDADAAASVGDELGTEDMVQLMSCLADGSAWYENILRPPDGGPATPARFVLPENFTSWTKLMEELAL